jgi:hypothetical protein
MERQCFAKMFGLSTAIVLGTSLSAMASTVDLQFTWDGSLWQSGYTATYVSGADAIGIYKFNVAEPNPLNVPNPLYSVCLSPAGLLDSNPHTYTAYPFNQSGIGGSGTQGIYPSAWAQGGGQQWGVNNAAFLWSTYGMGIVSANNSSAAAALEFAIWTALYDSTGYGKLGAPNNWLAPTAQMDATTLGYYNNYVAAISSAPNHAMYTGDILQSTIADQGAGSGGSQEFFMLGTPVPEPTTMVMGAVLLLPFGASTLRMLRKSRIS